MGTVKCCQKEGTQGRKALPCGYVTIVTNLITVNGKITVTDVIELHAERCEA